MERLIVRTVCDTPSCKEKGNIVRSVYRRSRATVTAVLLSAVATVGLQASPAQAAYGVCNTTATYGGEVSLRVPARTDNGTSCYIAYGTGSDSAVRAVQDAIYFCYRGTTAYDRMIDSGGRDGRYGDGMVSAMKWLQANKLGLSGSDVDGVYGPTVRDRLQWPLRWVGGTPVGVGDCSRY